MNFLTKEMIKANSRIDNNYEDTLIELWGNAAEDFIVEYTGRSLDWFFEQYGCIPPKVIQAGLMIADCSYQHRSIVTAQQLYLVPYGLDALLVPYVKQTFGDL